MTDSPQGRPTFSKSSSGSSPPTFTPGGGDDGGKAGRPWFKKKRFILPIVGLVLIIGASASGGGAKKSTDTAAPASATNTTAKGLPTTAAVKATTTAVPKLYPDRVDSQPKDQERKIGDSVLFSGYTTAVVSAGYQQQLNVIETDGYVVANVSIENRDTKSQSYSSSDWKIQTPGGQVVDSWLDTDPGAISRGDLVHGGKVTGNIAFKAGVEKGAYYIIYKPDPYDASRGIWKVSI